MGPRGKRRRGETGSDVTRSITKRKLAPKPAHIIIFAHGDQTPHPLDTTIHIKLHNNTVQDSGNLASGHHMYRMPSRAPRLSTIVCFLRYINAEFKKKKKKKRCGQVTVTRRKHGSQTLKHSKDVQYHLQVDGTRLSILNCRDLLWINCKSSRYCS